MRVVWGPTNGLMGPAHVAVNGVPAGQVAFFNIVISDVVGATNSPFVQGPASNAVYYGTSGTFTATIPGSISCNHLYPTPGNPTMSTWTPADLVINAVANPPTVTLVVFPQAGGELQIVTSATLTVRAYDFVLESSTNFIAWTAMDTNALSYNSTTENLMGTNVVEMTNSMTFYRVEAVGR